MAYLSERVVLRFFDPCRLMFVHTVVELAKGTILLSLWPD